MSTVVVAAARTLKPLKTAFHKWADGSMTVERWAVWEGETRIGEVTLVNHEAGKVMQHGVMRAYPASTDIRALRRVGTGVRQEPVMRVDNKYLEAQFPSIEAAARAI